MTRCRDAMVEQQSRWRQLRQWDKKTEENEFHCDVLREDKMDAPIHTDCIHSGGETTNELHRVEPTPSVPSSCVSKVHQNIVVQLDDTTLAYEVLRTSKSRVKLLRKQIPWIPQAESLAGTTLPRCGSV